MDSLKGKLTGEEGKHVVCSTCSPVTYEKCENEECANIKAALFCDIKRKGWIKQNPVEIAKEIISLLKETEKVMVHSSTDFSKRETTTLFGMTFQSIGEIFEAAIKYLEGGKK